MRFWLAAALGTAGVMTLFIGMHGNYADAWRILTSDLAQSEPGPGPGGPIR